MLSTILPAYHTTYLSFGWRSHSSPIHSYCTPIVPTPLLPILLLLGVLCLACRAPGWASGTILMLSTAIRDAVFIGLSYGLVL